MLWKHEPQENTFLKKEINLFILFVHAIVTSTACASSVSPLSYTVRNTILNQSARVFALGYFLIYVSSICIIVMVIICVMYITNSDGGSIHIASLLFYFLIVSLP